MPEPQETVQSNTERGLERHVDPANPTGPLLEQKPDLSSRLTPQDHNRHARKRAKSVRKAKARTTKKR